MLRKGSRFVAEDSHRRETGADEEERPRSRLKALKTVPLGYLALSDEEL